MGEAKRNPSFIDLPLSSNVDQPTAFSFLIG
jgi:hypothetical protein